LWTEGYIKLPKITREEIRDKNKVDGVLRIFTIFQIVCVGKNLLESVLLVLERAAYKSGLLLSLPPYENLGLDALFTCDICLYIPVDSTLLHSLVAIERKLSSSALQIPTVWFIVDMAGRRAQNLAITCGELTTAAFIVCSFGTVLCWIYKPTDVTTSVIIKTNAFINKIRNKAGD
jgi:hypothetical protein